MVHRQYSRTLWDKISVWIRELGMADYNLTTTRIIIGDLENALAINSIILHTKKIICNAKKKEQKPNIINVKYEVNNIFIKRSTGITSKIKKIQFEKQYNLLSNLYDKKIEIKGK